MGGESNNAKARLTARGGCYSPSEVIELAGPRVMSLAEIRLADCEDGWRASHGFGFNSGDHWGSWSPIFAAYPAFPSRHDALVAEIERLRDHISKREGPEADKIRRWLDDLIPSQADLFA